MNIHVGVVIWKLINSYKSTFKQEKLKDYYFDKYTNNFEGFKIAKDELLRLKKFCFKNNINCHLFLMPDIHKLNPYELSFINEKMSKVSKELKYNYLDLLPVFDGQSQKKIWNDYGDPHPSALELMPIVCLTTFKMIFSSLEFLLFFLVFLILIKYFKNYQREIINFSFIFYSF